MKQILNIQHLHISQAKGQSVGEKQLSVVCGFLKGAVCTACSSSAGIGLEKEDARTPYPPPPRAQQCSVRVHPFFKIFGAQPSTCRAR